jgi:hypothetical protein
MRWEAGRERHVVVVVRGEAKFLAIVVVDHYFDSSRVGDWELE